MGRGIEGARIFRNNRDRASFVRRLEELCSEQAILIYAWALMPNHFHLLARTGKQSLAKSMRRLLTGYVVNFNRRHARHGHLFQNRYKSIVCEEDPYLLELVRYIHLNPLRSGLVKNMDELNSYPWSGHSGLRGAVHRPWQDTDAILSHFGDDRLEAVRRYEVFVGEGISRGRRPELVGGGLVRSMGGWSEVLSARGRGQRFASDRRILGSAEFVSTLLSDAEEKHRKAMRFAIAVPDLVALGKMVAEGEGVDQSSLRSASRRRGIAKARRVFCQLAIGQMKYPGAEVARFLGVSTSAVNRLANSKQTPELERYLKINSEPTSPNCGRVDRGDRPAGPSATRETGETGNSPRQG